MLQLTYDIEPDRHGIIHEITLSRMMMENTLALLSPYAGNCLNCTASLMSSIGNDLIETAFQENDPRKSFKGTFLSVMEDGKEKERAFKNHLAIEKKEVRAILEAISARHSH